jgi:hypothetical protein
MGFVATSLVAIAALLAVARFNGKERQVAQQGRASVEPELPRLEYYTGELERLRLWVSLSVDPIEWVEVRARAGNTLTLAQGGPADLAAVRAYVTTYPSGVVLELQPSAGLPLPPRARYFDRTGPTLDHVLSRADLAYGESRVRVTFGPSPARPGAAGHYATHVTNIGKGRVRVVRFGGYACVGADRFRLHTVTGDLFAAAEFQQWYGVKEPNGWLNPGEVATDPENYGGGCGLWAYELEDERGQRFWTGATR